MAAPPVRTVRQIIQSAYRKLSAGSDGDTLSAEDLAYGLTAFQDLLAEAGGGGGSMVLPSILPEQIAMVIGQTEYTIGEHGVPDRDAVRPNQIDNAFIKRTGSGSNYSYPVQIIGQNAFARIVDKDISGSNFPEYLWYNPTVPNGTITVYRPPTNTDTLFLYYPKQFIDGAKQTDDIMIDLGIPRNYNNPLIYMLAIDLAPELGLDPPAVVVARADKGERALMALAARNSSEGMVIDFAVGRGYGGNIDPYG
jgi:hypothetical protein